MGLLKDWYDSHNSEDFDDWEELDCDDLVYDEDEDDDDNDWGEDDLDTPVRLPESLLSELGNMVRAHQQRWEDQHSSARESSREYVPKTRRGNDRNYSSPLNSSREYIPDTGWTRDRSSIEYIGGPIKLGRDGYSDIVTVFQHGEPMYDGRGFKIRVPENRRATSAYWCDGMLYVQLSNGRVLEYWGPYQGIEK